MWGDVSGWLGMRVMEIIIIGQLATVHICDWLTKVKTNLWAWWGEDQMWGEDQIWRDKQMWLHDWMWGEDWTWKEVWKWGEQTLGTSNVNPPYSQTLNNFKKHWFSSSKSGWNCCKIRGGWVLPFLGSLHNVWSFLTFFCGFP